MLYKYYPEKCQKKLTITTFEVRLPLQSNNIVVLLMKVQRNFSSEFFLTLSGKYPENNLPRSCIHVHSRKALEKFVFFLPTYDVAGKSYSV